MFRVRLATEEDDAALRDLIARSVRGLAVSSYDAETLEAALGTVLGLDTQLITDRTYFAVEEPAGSIVACGGWSRRKTLYGSDAHAERDAAFLDPAVDAAKIRAFFVDPGWARRGLGTLLLETCENAAAAAGFRRFELGATLSGIPLYAAKGYGAGERVDVPLRDGHKLGVVKMVKRRELFGLLAALPVKGAAGAPVPIRRITQPGDGSRKFHWFGYYDKLQFDPKGRYVLGQQVDFEHRSPKAEDVIRVGIIDTQKGDTWKELGTTRAWNWQQGCMLQWLPGSDREVMWNDREGDQFVCRVHDLKSGKTRTIGAPVYTLSPDGKTGLAPDFRRLNDCRPGYGYAGIADPYAGDLAPTQTGLWKIDMRTGARKLLFDFASVSKIPHREPFSNGAKHWFNHLLFNTDGSRFIFLHRWRGDKEKAGFSTRMFTADVDGGGLYPLDPWGKTSHFIWRDPKTVLAWAWHPSHGDAFYVYEDKTEKVEVIGKGVMTVNGHCVYLPGNKWILNDTYPDKERLQHLYLYEVASGKRLPLADLLSPKEYVGEWRTDLHARFSPDGKKVCIDSTHEGLGRQMYLLDISSVAS
jgi:GNAT superfamily N-acetyltransferase